MSGINEMFADNPMYNVFEVVTGTASFTQFPTGTAKLLRFKANPANIGTFELITWGSSQQGTYPLDAGDDTDWIAAPYNANNLEGVQSFGYRNISGSSDYLHYWIQK